MTLFCFQMLYHHCIQLCTFKIKECFFFFLVVQCCGKHVLDLSLYLGFTLKILFSDLFFGFAWPNLKS